MNANLRETMAFVAFGRKKVSSAQQPASDNPGAPAASTDQASASARDPDIQVAQNDLEGFKISELDVEDGHQEVMGPGPGAEFANLGGAVFCESPTFGDKQILGNGMDGGGIPQILEHNVALRRNFDNLKQLHLQLAEANAQLQEAFLRLQEDKAEAERGLSQCDKLQHENGVIQADLEEMRSRHIKELTLLKKEHDEISVLARELEHRNKSLENKMASIKGENSDLILKLESARAEKEKILIAKHSAELQYTRELSIVKVDDHTFRQQAADLAHKVQCKHLEMELEKAIAAGDTAHQKLVALTYEKDSTIMDLEQALHRVREDLQEVEKRRKLNESEWQIEKQRLQSKVEEKERQEHVFKTAIKEEADQKVKDASKEVTELRAMLVMLEKPRADAELRHLEILKELTKERDSLRQDLGTALAAQKDNSDRIVEMEQIRAQLSDALARNHESCSQIAENRVLKVCTANLRKAREELERSSETLKSQLAELAALRDRENVAHAHQLEDAQRKWAADKSFVLMRAERTIKDGQKDFICKSRSLKKKLKQTQKLLATMTVDNNQLLIRVRECEAQLAIAQSTRFQTPIPTPIFPKPFLTIDSARFRAEMKELGERQAKYFHNPEASTTPRGCEQRQWNSGSDQASLGRVSNNAEVCN